MSTENPGPLAGREVPPRSLRDRGVPTPSQLYGWFESEIEGSGGRLLDIKVEGSIDAARGGDEKVFVRDRCPQTMAGKSPLRLTSPAGRRGKGFVGMVPGFLD